MTINAVAFNPMITTNAPGSFSISTAGAIQGMAFDDPAVRNGLAGGYYDPAETVPMWGGVAISEYVPGAASTPANSQGPRIGRATNVAAATAGQITGFSVFNQNHAALTSPQQQVPISLSYQLVNFYRLGSNAQIAVGILPALVTAEGSIVTQQFSWDFGAQQIAPFIAAYPANVFTALTRAASGAGGTYVATATTTTNHGVAVGDVFTVSGQTPAAYNGNWVAAAGTATNQLVWNLGTTVDPGASTVLGQVNAGGGALPVQVLEIYAANSMTVAYNAVTGALTWNRSGYCARILL